jgi:hypothetical protein
LDGYPCSDKYPVVLAQDGVTIIRGPKATGYNFLNDTPAPITMITVATKKKIEKYTDKGRGKYLYKNNDDKEDIRNRVRVVLLAVAMPWCSQHWAVALKDILLRRSL